MGAGKKQTIGYRYFFSLQMGIGRGPINEMVEIRVGGVTAYDSPIYLAGSGQLIQIDKPDLFGGEKKEGGIQGPMYVYNGAADQVLQPALGSLPSIAASLGGDVPNFRGVVTCWFDGLVAAMNPYPKEWSFRVRRHSAGWFNNDPWNEANAKIEIVAPGGKLIHAMNAAHILYEVNTNPEWGRGMPASLIDADSYAAAALTLYGEGFGLCIPWFRQETIKEFIPVVINHIAAVQYVSRETGLLTLNLIRGGYDSETLPLYTLDSGLVDVIDDDSSGEETAYNEIIVNGFDPTTKEAISARAQNLASIQSQEEIISNTIEYKGIPHRNLLSKVALRELKVQMPLRKMTVILDRRGWRIAPGSLFRIAHPGKGISNIVLRAGEVNDGTLKNGKISVKAVQDVFGMPDTAFTTPTESGWTPPDFEALPARASRLIEMGYRDLWLVLPQADIDALSDDAAYIGQMAAPENAQQRRYDLATHPTGESYETYIEEGDFVGYGQLAANLPPLATALTLTNYSTFPADPADYIGEAAMIGDEVIEIVSFDTGTGLMTIKRGAADTIPQVHSTADYLWLSDDDVSSDGREYVAGETIYSKVLPRTSTEVLDPADAPEASLLLVGRQARPFPPGNLLIDGDSPLALAGDLEAVYPVELTLVNPGAETGDTTGWTQSTGGGFNVIGEAHTGTYGFVGSTSSATAEWYQDVPVPAYVENDIDNGLIRIDARTWINSWTGDNDYGRFYVEARNEAGDVLAVDDTGNKEPDVWTQIGVVLLLPPLTRTIRFRAYSKRLTGTQNSVYWDDFTGTLESIAQVDIVRAEPLLTWAHRDRVLQQDQIVTHDEASIGPEPGVTYTVRIYDADTELLLNSYPDIAADTWTYTSALQAADAAPQEIIMEMVSVRDSLESWQSYRFNVLLYSGWGDLWGDNWGGGAV